MPDVKFGCFLLLNSFDLLAEVELGGDLDRVMASWRNTFDNEGFGITSGVSCPVGPAGGGPAGGALPGGPADGELLGLGAATVVVVAGSPLLAAVEDTLLVSEAVVAAAVAVAAIGDAEDRLLVYIYVSFQKQSTDGISFPNGKTTGFFESLGVSFQCSLISTISTTAVD